MPWMTFALAVGIGASIVCALYHGVIAYRVAMATARIPTARDGIALAAKRADPPPAACVIVPAHNEERMIGGLVRSLAAQDYPGLRIVLALDRCTDGTERAARAAIAETPAPERFEVVVIAQCPPGWAGKVHAVHAGVTRSEGARDARILVFADADTELDPRCISAAAALLAERDADLLSLMCTLTSGLWWEKVAQPAAGIELVRRFPLDRLNRPDGRIPFANGQFLMFRREAYDEIGGHEAVKGELLEDLALAAKVVHHKRNRRLAVLMAEGMARCRMYESMPEFRKGWKRIYTESYRRDSQRLRTASWHVTALGVIAPVASGITLIAGAVLTAMGDPHGLGPLIAGLVGVGAAVIGLGQMYAAQGVGWWWSMTHPFGAWVTVSILREAARDLDAGRRTEWGGMSYAREPRA